MSTSSTSSTSSLLNLSSYGVGPGPNRITGLATGLDIDSLVSEMMMAKTQPIDEMKQKEQIMEWTRNAYRGMNTQISTLQTAVSNLRYQYNFAAQKSTTDNTGVTATANSSASSGNYTMTVHQLATAASLVSQSAIGVAQDTTQPLNTSGAMTINVTGATGTKQITIAQNSTITSIASAINAQAGATGVNCSYDSTTDRLYFTSTTTGANSMISLSGVGTTSQTFLSNTLKIATPSNSVVTGTKAIAPGAVIDSGLDPAQPLSFSINSHTFTITNTTTVANLQDQVAKAGLSPNVVFSQDANGNIQLQSTGTITLADGAADTSNRTALKELGLTAGSYSGNQTEALATGTDTVVDFNGVSGIHFHTNAFLLNNINFAITTPPAAGSSYDVHVTVSQDTDTIYNNIKAFVDAYNSTVDAMTAKLNEPKYYDYKPLTSAQQSQMNSNDITLWNQKAQSGMIQGDSTLENALDTFKNLVNGPVTSTSSGQYKMLSDIGIAQLPPGTTDAYQDNGKLYIDDTKLKQAISTNPQQVIALFTNMGNTSISMNTPDQSQGIAERLYRATTNSITALTAIAGNASMTVDTSSLGLQITDINSQIQDADSQLAGYQQQYYTQFSQLETSINNFNSQKAYLNSAFGGSSGG